MVFLLLLRGRFVNHSWRNSYTLTQRSVAVKLQLRDCYSFVTRNFAPRCIPAFRFVFVETLLP